MGDPILLLLAIVVVALLLLGMLAANVPRAVAGLIVTSLCGLGIILSLTPLLLRHLSPTVLTLPAGPPGLSLHFALDPLATCFLLITFIAGAAIAAVQATAAVQTTAAASMRATACCLAGTALLMLAADGVALAIGLAIALRAIWPSRTDGYPTLLIPLLLLAAVCLLTPPGFAPRFDTIAAAPVEPDRVAAAAAAVILAVTLLAWFRPRQRCAIRDALLAGVVIPSASYILLRLVADLSGSGIPALWGFVLLLTGSATAIIQARRSAAEPEIDAATLCLSQRHAGLAMIGIGLTLVARAGDLPGAASFALAGTMLSSIGGGIAGTLTSLAVHGLGRSARTYRLSHLGGLMHQHPATSAAFAAGLLGHSGMLPGFGFACLWLLLQSILSAPRGSGLAWQLPLALTAAAIAVSAAFATASAVRLIGIALLGRPPASGITGTADGKASLVLLVLASLSLLAGLLPGTTIWVLASPSIQGLTSTSPSGSTGIAFLSFAISAPGYLALPVLALLALATGAALLTRRGSRRDDKAVGVWTDGMAPSAAPPFEPPEARSPSATILPSPTGWRPPALPCLTLPPAVQRPCAVAMLWLLLAGWIMLLLVLAVA